MDFKLIRVSVLAFVSAMALIVVAVLATNSDLFKRGSPDDSSAAASSYATDEGTATEFGERIGDDLKAFLKDPEFFDDATDNTSGYSEQDVTSLTLLAESTDTGLEARIMNNSTGELEMGVLFRLSVAPSSQARSEGEERVFTDENEDGRIEAVDLPAGIYDVKLLAQEGYHVPAEPLVVTVGVADASTGSATGDPAPEPVEGQGDENEP